SELPPLIPAVEAPIYKQPKAVIGTGRVRRWKWVPFKNSAREDGLVLYHWRREDSDLNEDYHFARLNKHVEVPEFSEADYLAYLKDSKWTLEQTNHLMDLARQFDVRFIHMHDRWDAERFPPRPSVEELKARYYGILGAMDKIRGTNLSQGLRYDLDHERRRKQQLSLLYGRSRDEVEEEERLICELNRIEARRKDREKKKQDLQKLISQAEAVVRDSSSGVSEAAGDESKGFRRLTSVASSAASSATPERKKSTLTSQGFVDGAASGANCRSAGSISAGLAAASSAVSASLSASTTITFPDLAKTAGVYLHSQKMKLPSSLGQKRIRVIENFLSHYQLDPSPPATGEIVDAYNRLRGNILLLYDLRGAMLQCDYELQAARARMELFAADKQLPPGLASAAPNPATASLPSGALGGGGGGGVIPPGVDPSVVAALKAADSKRPVPPRHSLGHAGSLAAAAGSAQRTPSALLPPPPQSPLIGSGSSPASSSSLGGGSPAYFFGQPPSVVSTEQRRKRAAAAEQGRVMKKLKAKGHLLE
uniref:DNA methyltransferase 1-associated protein 1 n=1 Tax=Mesocestoides corti TaxID=53468 RepID=A0A5K3FLS5_MESCO